MSNFVSAESHPASASVALEGGSSSVRRSEGSIEGFRPFALSSMLWAARYLAPSAWVEHVPFAFWIVDALRPRVVVELGSHYGTSYFAFCQAVERLELDAQCYAVDTWKGDDQAGFYGEEVFQSVSAYNTAQYSAFSNLIRSTFDEALPHFGDGSIDLLHIDGHHTFDSVRHDFETWLPKLSARAVVVFHDTNVRWEKFGVARYFSSLREKYPAFEFQHGHGLGVLSVGGERTELVRRLVEVDDRSAAAHSVRQVFARLGHCCAEALASKEFREGNASLQSEIDSLRAQLEGARQSLHESEESRRSASGHVADLLRQLEVLETRSAASRGELAERVTLLTEAREAERGARDREQALTEALVQELRNSVAAARGENAGLEGQRAALEGRLGEVERELALARGENAGLEGQRAALEGRLGEVERELALARGENTGLLEEVERVRRVGEERATRLEGDLASKVLEFASERTAAEMRIAEMVEGTRRVLETEREALAAEKARLLVDWEERIAGAEASAASSREALATAQLELETQLKERDRLQRNLGERLGSAERERDALKQNVDERFRELAQLTKMLLERDQRITELESALGARGEALAQEEAGRRALSDALEELRRSSGERIAALERERDALKRNVDERFRELAHMAQMLSHRDVAIEESRAAAGRMKGSLSWRVTKPLRWLGSSFGQGAKEKKRLQKQREVIRGSGLFDEGWYKSTYPDVVQSGMDAIEHYLRHGAREGRNPGPRFQTQNYLKRYPDVARAVPPINPLLHYVLHGKKEGRLA